MITPHMSSANPTYNLWSVEETIAWLQANRLTKYVDLFRDRKLRVGQLINCRRDDLNELGIQSASDQNRMLEALETLHLQQTQFRHSQVPRPQGEQVVSSYEHYIHPGDQTNRPFRRPQPPEQDNAPPHQGPGPHRRSRSPRAHRPQTSLESKNTSFSDMDFSSISHSPEMSTKMFTPSPPQHGCPGQNSPNAVFPHHNTQSPMKHHRIAPHPPPPQPPQLNHPRGPPPGPGMHSRTHSNSAPSNPQQRGPRPRNMHPRAHTMNRIHPQRGPPPPGAIAVPQGAMLAEGHRPHSMIRYPNNQVHGVEFTRSNSLPAPHFHIKLHPPSRPGQVTEIPAAGKESPAFWNKICSRINVKDFFVSKDYKLNVADVRKMLSQFRRVEPALVEFQDVAIPYLIHKTQSQLLEYLQHCPPNVEDKISGAQQATLRVISSPRITDRRFKRRPQPGEVEDDMVAPPFDYETDSSASDSQSLRESVSNDGAGDTRVTFHNMPYDLLDSDEKLYEFESDALRLYNPIHLEVEGNVLIVTFSFPMVSDQIGELTEAATDALSNMNYSKTNVRITLGHEEEADQEELRDERSPRSNVNNRAAMHGLQQIDEEETEVTTDSRVSAPHEPPPYYTDEERRLQEQMRARPSRPEIFIPGAGKIGKIAIRGGSSTQLQANPVGDSPCSPLRTPQVAGITHRVVEHMEEKDETPHQRRQSEQRPMGDNNSFWRLVRDRVDLEALFGSSAITDRSGAIRLLSALREIGTNQIAPNDPAVRMLQGHSRDSLEDFCRNCTRDQMATIQNAVEGENSVPKPININLPSFAKFLMALSQNSLTLMWNSFDKEGRGFFHQSELADFVSMCIVVHLTYADEENLRVPREYLEPTVQQISEYIVRKLQHQQNTADVIIRQTDFARFGQYVREMLKVFAAADHDSRARRDRRTRNKSSSKTSSPPNGQDEARNRVRKYVGVELHNIPLEAIQNDDALVRFEASVFSLVGVDQFYIRDNNVVVLKLGHTISKKDVIDVRNRLTGYLREINIDAARIKKIQIVTHTAKTWRREQERQKRQKNAAQQTTPFARVQSKDSAESSSLDDGVPSHLPAESKPDKIIRTCYSGAKEYEVEFTGRPFGLEIRVPDSGTLQRVIVDKSKWKEIKPGSTVCAINDVKCRDPVVAIEKLRNCGLPTRIRFGYPPASTRRRKSPKPRKPDMPPPPLKTSSSLHPVRGPRPRRTSPARFSLSANEQAREDSLLPMDNIWESFSARVDVDRILSSSPEGRTRTQQAMLMLSQYRNCPESEIKFNDPAIEQLNGKNREKLKQFLSSCTRPIARIIRGVDVDIGDDSCSDDVKEPERRQTHSRSSPDLFDLVEKVMPPESRAKPARLPFKRLFPDAKNGPDTRIRKFMDPDTDQMYTILALPVSDTFNVDFDGNFASLKKISEIVEAQTARISRLEQQISYNKRRPPSRRARKRPAAAPTSETSTHHQRRSISSSADSPFSGVGSPFANMVTRGGAPSPSQSPEPFKLDPNGDQWGGRAFRGSQSKDSNSANNLRAVLEGRESNLRLSPKWLQPKPRRYNIREHVADQRVFSNRVASFADADREMLDSIATDMFHDSGSEKADPSKNVSL